MVNLCQNSKYVFVGKIILILLRWYWNEEVNADKLFKELKNFDKIVENWPLTFESIDNSGEGKYELQFNRL